MNEETRRATLYNRDVPVMTVLYNDRDCEILDVLEIHDIRYAPLHLETVCRKGSRQGYSLKKEFNHWFAGRGIPAWRRGLPALLEALDVSAPQRLLMQAFAMSLSDQYWLKPEGTDIRWEDISFFRQSFDGSGYMEFLFSGRSSGSGSLPVRSPNNTTDGMIQKTWIVQDGTRKLIKGSYTQYDQEPINEWLASTIAKRLGFAHCPYEIREYENQIVSVCDCFIREDEEIITADQVYESERKPKDVSDYEHYLRILESHGIPEARKRMEEMIIIDFLMQNTDRHMKNFGIIRNVKTLEWTGAVPIFDTGQGMYTGVDVSSGFIQEPKGKFFTNTAKRFGTYPALLKEYRSLDLACLEGVPEAYRQRMEETQRFTHIPDQRIGFLVRELEKQIRTLQRMMDRG